MYLYSYHSRRISSLPHSLSPTNLMGNYMIFPRCIQVDCSLAGIILLWRDVWNARRHVHSMIESGVELPLGHWFSEEAWVYLRPWGLLCLHWPCCIGEVLMTPEFHESSRSRRFYLSQLLKELRYIYIQLLVFSHCLTVNFTYLILLAGPSHLTTCFVVRMNQTSARKDAKLAHFSGSEE